MAVYDDIWTAALNQISARPRSKHELRQHLEDKFDQDTGTVLKVLEELERVHLLNDRNFTSQFLDHLIQKPIGRMKIAIETRKKGLDPELVDAMLLEKQWSAEASCHRAKEEKERTLREEDPRKKKQKLMNFLRNRGFKDATIYKCLKD